MCFRSLDEMIAGIINESEHGDKQSQKNCYGLGGLIAKFRI